MPFIVAHFLIPVLVLELLGRYSPDFRKSINSTKLAIAGFFGILPDIDIAINWIVNLFYNPGFNLHRTFTHSFFAPLIIVLLALAFRKYRPFLLFAAFGWAMHITLDVLLSGTVPALYPLANKFGFKFLVESSATPEGLARLIGLELVVLAAWIIYKRSFLKK